MLFFRASWLLCAGLLSVCAGQGSEKQGRILQDLRSAAEELAGRGRTYLGRLAEEQTVVSVQKAFSRMLTVVAVSLASGLNVLLQYTSQLLQAAGVQVRVPATKVTAEGVIFVTQWILLALVVYWLFSHVLQLVSSTLRWVLWLLQVGVALACFIFILNDYRVGTETMVLRLAGLVCVCVLLGVGFSTGPNAADKTARLEEQVRVLEKRLREMERWTG